MRNLDLDLLRTLDVYKRQVHRWTGWEFDIYGFWGLLISNVFYALPQAVLILQAALRNTDARYYDACLLYTSRCV